ncbi:MAG: DUF3570 domain-containing protein [Bacteroidota bacterium]
MKKVYLSVLGFAFLCRVNAYAQLKSSVVVNKPAFTVNAPIKDDTTEYKSRALKLEEVNLVSSYYSQTGEHSAITGGIGTQNVTDLSNGIDVKLSWLGNGYNKNNLSIGVGLDHHTSASSAYVTTTGKGKEDGSRIYPSLDWTLENSKTGSSFGLGTYYSSEYNYKSLGADLHFSQKTRDKNGEFSIKAQAYLDHVTLIYPSEFVVALSAPAPAGSTYITTASGNRVLVSSGSSGSTRTSEVSLPTTPRNTYTGSLSYSQIINSKLQLMVLADVVQQNGYLGLPYHRVYMNSGKDTLEKLPSSRFKLPLGFRANYFLGDNIILRSYYRYYMDSWDTKSNTINFEVAYKISPFLSLSPFYRYYDQSASKYFAPYKAHTAADAYYTSNYEYAKFRSDFYGMGIRIAPPKGVVGWQQLHDIEIRYGHYAQSVNLVSDVFSVSLGFK